MAAWQSTRRKKCGGKNSMATRTVRAQRENELERMIDDYQAANAQKAIYTKDTKTIGDKIKTMFLDNDIEVYSTAKFTAKVTKTEKEDFDEELGIEILRKLVQDGELSQEKFNLIVKTQEYVDDAELEVALYNGEINATTLEKALIKKDPTYTLRVTKKK